MWDSFGAVALFGGVFTFLAVAAWAESRTRERELFYRNELLKKAMEMPGEAATAIVARLKEEKDATERSKIRQKEKDLLVGGLVVSGVGIALTTFMLSLSSEANQYFLVGLIPLSVGIALLIAARLTREK